MDCTNCKLCDKLDQHEWRIQCMNCRCPIYSHFSYAKLLDTSNQSSIDWINKMNTTSHNQLTDYLEHMKMAESNNLVWLPIGIRNDEIKNFLPLWNEIGQPYSLENNELNRLNRTIVVLSQIPKDDWILNPDEKFSDDDLIRRIEQTFKKNRDLNHLGFGEIDPFDPDEVCTNCEQPFKSSDKYCIRINHAASYVSHLSCFRCQVCQGNLVDFHYCWNEETSSVFCLKHFGELKYNRCFGCNELIFNKDFTRAMDKEFHEEHFACSNCDNSLTGAKYILKDDQPYCLNCYETNYGNTCDRCEQKISCNSKDLSFDNRHWHDTCFFCEGCLQPLVDKTFATKEKDIYCPDCFDNKFSSHCDGCGEIFKSGVKKYDYGGKEWHENCFLCGDCNQSIGAKSFIPKNGKMICISCYEEKYAQKCSKCGEIIRKGGVTYKGEPWHKECFLCTSCQKGLASTKFTSKDEKPYCADCFAELFSKRCKKCSKPISGFGGCKFISLEDDHWHTECFTCSQCQASLVGKGFMTHNEAIVCSDCGEKSSSAVD